jgi:hypothetical protein
VNMVGRNYIIENRQAVTLLRLKDPMQVPAPIACSERVDHPL